MDYPELETRRIELRRELEKLDAIANEADELLRSLVEVMEAAGCSMDWAEPEPRGIDAHFARVVSALHGGSHSPEAVQIATRSLVDGAMELAEMEL